MLGCPSDGGDTASSETDAASTTSDATGTGDDATGTSAATTNDAPTSAGSTSDAPTSGASESGDGSTAASTDDSTTTTGAVPGEPFSFFVTSLKAMQELSGSQQGFGGDLRFGEEGPAPASAGPTRSAPRSPRRACPAPAASRGGRSSAPAPTRTASRSTPSTASATAPGTTGSGVWSPPARTTCWPSGPSAPTRRSRTTCPTRTVSPITSPIRCRTLSTITTPSPAATSTVASRVPRRPASTGPPRWARATSTASPCSATPGRAAGRGRGPGPGPGDMDGTHWIRSHGASGCAPGVNLIEMGPSPPGANTVGAGGGYGGIYCFSLVP
ncbi:hypothetical protein [Nannocystis pusilla]|uniref:hypothetical protein n=1 Tax=Nannocystis pusilla TaxID=889268 RepID=UPI003B823A03